MDIGTTQTVEVTVAAIGGEAGRLEGLDFADPGILALAESPDAALQILAVSEVIPSEGFSLTPNTSRTFAVEVQAVGLGEGAVIGAVSGRDDLGQRFAVNQGSPILVEYAETVGADAPAPPMVTVAADRGDGANDDIAGTVTGTPETTTTVSLATSAIRLEDRCAQLMAGDGVDALGTFPVTIGADGMGNFALTGALTPGNYVYGITTVGPSVSEVGECTPVTQETPEVRVEGEEQTEGTGTGDTTLAFTLSLSAPSTRRVSVDVRTIDGSATAPDDYASVAPTTIEFNPGETDRTVSVTVARDKAEEADEGL